MPERSFEKFVFVIGFAIICIAVIGYFVGLQSPMNPMGPQRLFSKQSSLDPSRDAHPSTSDSKGSAIFATDYSDMAEVTQARAAAFSTDLAELNGGHGSLDGIEIAAGEKASALAIRAKNRAYNGAPPTVPHATEEMDAKACAACHTSGAKTDTLRISAMSHPFLSNCTQCHVESAPRQFVDVGQFESLFDGNSFVGLAAPTVGPRAYEGAPPQVPHSTWMRSNCMSCHGYAGLQGIRTTHPWQQNCQQCHANQSELEQVMVDERPSFLPPPKVNN